MTGVVCVDVTDRLRSQNSLLYLITLHMTCVTLTLSVNSSIRVSSSTLRHVHGHLTLHFRPKTCNCFSKMAESIPGLYPCWTLIGKPE